jgi:hypothetical protein
VGGEPSLVEHTQLPGMGTEMKTRKNKASENTHTKGSSMNKHSLIFKRKK